MAATGAQTATRQPQGDAPLVEQVRARHDAELVPGLEILDADGTSRRISAVVTTTMSPLLETGDRGGGGGRRATTSTGAAVAERFRAELRRHDGFLGLRGHVAASLLVRGLHHAVVVEDVAGEDRQRVVGGKMSS